VKSTKIKGASIEEQLRARLDRFLRDERAGESDAKIADEILKLIIECERLRHRVREGTSKAAAVDQQTRTKMKSWDSDDPSLAIVEKVLKRLAEGRGVDAVVLLKNAIAQRATAFIEKQREKARRPRLKKRLQLSELVEEIVGKHPSISENKLFHELRRKLLAMDNPPYSYSGSSFKSTNSRYPDVQRKNLRQFLYRAKKKLSR